jgi:ABC-type Fe3+/spermidine/putrescine transport system ATPase subunit
MIFASSIENRPQTTDRRPHADCIYRPLSVVSGQITRKKIIKLKPMTHIQITSLYKTYPNTRTPVLQDFNLSINAGEMVTLLGPSGSGKSTVLKIIAGIEQPDSGDILFDGESILNIEPNKRGAVLMFQKSYLFPFLNVEENIGFGLKMQGVSSETIQAEVKRMLKLIGLPGIEKRKVGQLSGGEGQRVALARALVTNPKLLMLDEPLSSLDTSVRMNLQAAIREIQRELGITTIFVTHDLSEAMAMSDRMAILLDGEVTAYDKPETLFHRPPCVRSAKFVGVDLFLEGESGNGWLEATDVGRVRLKDESKVGRSVFAIRPEHIRIQKEETENSLRGVVQSCLFRGEALELLVRIGNVTTRVRLPMPAPMFMHGEHVFVQLPAEHLFEVAGS